MREVEERPGGLVYVFVALAFIVYFFAAAFPLRKEISLRPAWARDVSRDAAPAAPVGDSPAGRLLAFSLGGRYGSVSRDGEVLFSRGAPFDVAVSDSLIVPYARDSAELTALGPDGSPRFRISAEGWPFFRSGRLFVVSPEMNSISEYSQEGQALWSYDFPFSVTEFAASPSLAVAGLLDGTLEFLDARGDSVLSFSPGGSRIEVILGTALSPDQEAVAAVCGADRQRFVLLSKKGGTFRVRRHRYLESDYREPVSVRFTRDGRYVLYRQPEGVQVFDREGGTESILPVRAQSFEVESDPPRGLEFLFARQSRSWTVACFQPPDRMIFSYILPGGAFWSRFADGSLYLGTGNTIGRIDIAEE